MARPRAIAIPVVAGSPLAPPIVVTRAAIAPLHAEPRVSSPQVSQLLAGWPASVRETSDEWLHVAGDDGYMGWLHRGFVDGVDRSQDSSEGAVGFARPPLVSLGCTLRGSDGVRRSLPLGALFDPGEPIETGEALPMDALADRFPRERHAVAATARDYFAGTGYQWGGITPWGADCSGLVQSCFRLHGRLTPRDAWQQFSLGTDAGTDLAALESGDLLFFSDRADRRITHVGISLGEMRMVHLAIGRGGYAIERLDDRDDPYVGKLLERFVGARRVEL